MKRIFLLMVHFFVVYEMHAQQKILQRVYGQAAPEYMINTDSSHYLVSGSWQYPPTDPFGFLTKLDSVGEILWCKQYADTLGSDIRFSQSYKLSTGNILLKIINVSGDYGIAAIIDPQGNVLNAKKYKNINNLYFQDFYENPDGTIMACGNMILYQGGSGAYINASVLIKLDAALNILWAKQYQYRHHDYFINIKPTANGNYILQGYSEDSTTFDNQIVLYKVDSIGNLIWAMQCGDSSNVTNGYNSIYEARYASHLIVEHDGEIINAFSVKWFTGNIDIVMQRIDSMGTELLAHQFGNFTTGGNTISAIIEDSSSNLYFSASRFIKCDSSFTIQWKNSFPFLPGIIEGGYLSICLSSVSKFATITAKALPSQTFAFVLVDSVGQSRCDLVNSGLYFNQSISVGMHDILTNVTEQNISIVDSFIIFYSQPFIVSDTLYCNTASAIQELINADEIKVFPNPTSEYLNIESKDKIENLVITDFLGRKLISDNLVSKIYIKNLSKGVYFLSFKNKEKIINAKFIKQ